MRVAVAVGTGLVGALTVAELERAGHETVVLARSTGVDLAQDGDALTEDLAKRLVGVDAVVDALNVVTRDATESAEFFGRTTAALLAAEDSAGVGHHLALSIVGIDRVPFDYYVGKLRQEELVTSGPVPWTILRAAQFHEFAGQLLGGLTFGPIGLAPRMPVRPVAAAEVAAHLARLAVEPPRRATLDLAGPHREDLASMARRTARRDGGPRLVVPVRVPGAFGRGVRAGALVPEAPDLVGRQSFAEWLRAR